MSVLKDRINKSKQEEEEIAESVFSNNFTPSEDEREKINTIIKTLSARFSNELAQSDVDELSDQILEAIAQESEKLNLPYESTKRIEKAVQLTVLGNGPIEQYLQDPTITEIVVQRYDNIVIERNGKIEKTDTVFIDEDHLQIIVKRIVQRVGRQINITEPIVDARLSDGSRVNATIPPVSVDGATLTIRKFSKNFMTGEDYVSTGSLDQRMLYFLACAVMGKLSIFVSGGTGTGKTTLLNMLSNYIPRDELIITIEDSCELQLQQPNVRRMEIRLAKNEKMMNVDQSQLVKSALRQRPDRIILGETRDGSIVDIISAMSTGHEGSMTTIHANSPENMVDVRVPILYSMNADVNFSERSIAMQFAEAVNMIVQIDRFPDGSRKISRITHVAGLKEKIELRDIFIYDREKQMFCWTGYIPYELIQKIQYHGYNIDMSIFN